MKQGWLTKILAVALAVTFAGCQSAPAIQEHRPTVAAASYPYAREYPAISATVALPQEPQVQLTSTSAASTSKEVRAVWLSYLEMQTLLQGKSQKQFSSAIAAAFDNVAGFGLNTVIVQVRPFGDALYDSDYFPWSYTITGTEGKDPGFDPLAIMVKAAKQRGLRIEAWLNPYRVRAAGNTNALSSSNQARKWQEAGGNGHVISYNGATSYNPASAKARELIVNGAVEIVQKYEVDGIHIDDYFYPTTDAAYDKGSYKAYQDGGGTLSLAGWRRSNVEKLIKQMYQAIKAENPKVLFGIAPQSSVANNYNQQYLDVKKIAGNSGYCDYICPQIYFGYDNNVQPYAETLQAWSDMVKNSKVKLYVGLAVYKVGVTDSWAGSGKDEWTGNSDLLRRMVEDARDSSSYQGFVLYRYDSIFSPATAVKNKVQQETKNLKAIL